MAGESHSDDRVEQRDERTVQPGTSISKSLWNEFREDVKQRRGRVRGVLAAEMENALRAYLDGSDGGDATDELRRLREDVDELREVVVEGATPRVSDGGAKNKKIPDGELGNFSDGVEKPVDNDVDERGIVEKRTDRAVSELVANNDTFRLDDVDEAIREGAGVQSGNALRDYRERVFRRMGGKNNVRLIASEDRPLDEQVFFTDSDELAYLNVKHLITEEGVDFERAVEIEDADPESVREQIHDRNYQTAISEGAVDPSTKKLIESAGYNLPESVDVVE